MSGSASSHMRDVVVMHFDREHYCVTCGGQHPCLTHTSVGAALVLVQEAITRLETIRDKTACLLYGRSDKDCLARGFRPCSTCSIRQDAVVALAALKGNT